MTKINNIKLSHKIFQLNQYLKQDLKEQQERIQMWAEAIEREGADTIAFPNIENNVTYGELHEKATARYERTKKEIQENEDLIKILEKNF